MTKLITPVILSGGAGSRLWPMSRLSKPKQLQPLAGSATMLQATATRVSNPALFAAPMIVASTRHEEEIARQLSEAEIAPRALILEPAARNTAAAIALAVLEADAEDLLLVLPSDHVIRDGDGFTRAVAAAAPLARNGWLVTFGIRPDRPEVGYGYIQRGEALAEGHYRCDRFVEKPDRATAETYLADGRFDWNAGIFLFQASAMRAAFEAHAPAILSGAQASIAAGERRGTTLVPAETDFAATPSEPVDTAIMERADRVAVVPVDIGWSDVGSWDVLNEIAPVDEAANVVTGDVLSIDTRGCELRSTGPLLVTIGVEDLVIVATGDAILVAKKGETQRVKEAVDALKKAGRTSLL